MTHTLKIREPNNAFRRLQSGGGKLLLTQGISTLPQVDQIAILGKVASFNDFSEDNDPHGESTTSARSNTPATASSGRSTTTVSRWIAARRIRPTPHRRRGF